MQKFDSKKESETRGKNGQVSKVELGVQRYPPEWNNGHVSDSRIRGTWCPLKKKRDWKKRKKMIAHGPSNKQYASKRWQTFQKGQRSWSRSMTFLSLASSIDIAKCKVSMIKLLKLYLYIFREEGKCLSFILETYKKLQKKGKIEELET